MTHAGVSGLADDDLVALGTALGAVRKDADRMMAVVAAEQAARSRTKIKQQGLARRKGKGDERGLVSGQTGGSEAEAGRLIELGETLRDAERASGGDEPPRDQEPAETGPVFSAVAAAVNAGDLSVEASTMITRMLKRVAKRCDAAAVAWAEKDLVSSARYLRLNKLAALITRTEERLDREHLEELARERRERRFLRIGEAADGMITINGRLDPENGAPLLMAMDAMVGQHFRLRKRMQDLAKAGESVVLDERTPEQVRADAMGDFARHVGGCEVDVLPRAGVTVVVRTNVEELREGLAGAGVDGFATGLDAGALRRAAARAGVIPEVMGGPSQVLDQGRAKRSFTQPQRIALVERDGGCAMCGAPPSWCDAHHIVHWSQGGRSDLDNGVLLCVRCHQDLHNQGWRIEATASEVWFTPPASVDPRRKRRPGGRRLFDALPLEPEPEPGSAPAGVPGEEEAVLLDAEAASANCAMAAGDPWVSVPAEVDDWRAPPDPIEREFERTLESELERWLRQVVRVPDAPAHLHSQATRRPIDA